MKLELEFPQLESLVRRMNARPIVWQIRIEVVEAVVLATELRTDGRILAHWDNLDVESDGLLSFEGYQIVLHIKDVQKEEQTLRDDPNEQPKYHICDCRTLEGMRERGRFERYVMSSRVDGLFLIDANGRFSSAEMELPLKPCMNCLERLNFQGFAEEKRADWARKWAIRDRFVLEEFFNEHRTRFQELPRYTDSDAPASGYSPDWDQVSRRYRESKRWICERCNVNLSDRANRGLLHTHHANGVKGDNNPANLKALCLHCHGKQPAHERMSAWFAEDWRRIEEIRRVQRIG